MYASPLCLSDVFFQLFCQIFGVDHEPEVIRVQGFIGEERREVRVEVVAVHSDDALALGGGNDRLAGLTEIPCGFFREGFGISPDGGKADDMNRARELLHLINEGSLFFQDHFAGACGIPVVRAVSDHDEIGLEAELCVDQISVINLAADGLVEDLRIKVARKAIRVGKE